MMLLQQWRVADHMRFDHHIKTHASCLLPSGTFEIFISRCSPACKPSISPSLSLLSCFCCDNGPARPMEFSLEVKVDAMLDIHSLAVLAELRNSLRQRCFHKKQQHGSVQLARMMLLFSPRTRGADAVNRNGGFSSSTTAFVAVAEERKKTSKSALRLCALHKQFLVAKLEGLPKNIVLKCICCTSMQMKCLKCRGGSIAPAARATRRCWTNLRSWRTGTRGCTA